MIANLRSQFPIKFFVFQQEVGERTGRAHWQAYFELFVSQRPSYVRRHFLADEDGTPWKAYLLPARENRETNVKYCTKEATRQRCPEDPHRFDPVIEESTLIAERGAKKKSDMADIGRALLAGVSPSEILPQYPGKFIHMRAMKEIHQDVIMKLGAPNRTAIHVTVLWGPTGGGKSSRVMQRAVDQGLPLDVIYTLRIHSDGNIWMPGYEPKQTVLLIDEFNGGCLIDKLLSLLDSLPYLTEVKGGHGPYAHWTQVVITSNRPPALWYGEHGATNYARKAAPVHIEALKSRLTVVEEVQRDVDYRELRRPVVPLIRL